MIRASIYNRALRHTSPQWDGPPRDPSNGYPVLRGVMRIVRNARRARLLKRRGVQFITSVRDGRKVWVWHVVCNNPTKDARTYCRVTQMSLGFAYTGNAARNRFIVNTISPAFLDAIRACGRSTLRQPTLAELAVSRIDYAEKARMLAAILKPEACSFCGTPLRTNQSERAYCPHCNR